MCLPDVEMGPKLFPHRRSAQREVFSLNLLLADDAVGLGLVVDDLL